MKCPVCVAIDLSMTERQGIEIDYCPQCRGVWLDRGELDKIVERSLGGGVAYAGDALPQAGVARSHHENHGHAHHGSYRKKSLWSELFD